MYKYNLSYRHSFGNLASCENGESNWRFKSILQNIVSIPDKFCRNFMNLFINNFFTNVPFPWFSGEKKHFCGVDIEWHQNCLFNSVATDCS